MIIYTTINKNINQINETHQGHMVMFLLSIHPMPI